jgi:uncharacterized protein (TIGR04255 family)
MKTVPSQITPDPILESLLELKFETSIPQDAVFGIVYNALSEIFSGKVENLPTLQIPSDIRDQDLNLRYKPVHRIKCNNFILQIGPRVIVVSNIRQYQGWKAFSDVIIEVFQKFNKLKIVSSWIDYTLRYINFFEFNILEQSNISLSVGDPARNYNHAQITTEIEEGGFIHNLKILNNATVTFDDKQLFGSIIDISTYKKLTGVNLGTTFKKMLTQSHALEKKIFFDLLKKDYVARLNPQYS